MMQEIMKESTNGSIELERNLSEKLSAALVNVSAKEDLVKQHAKVAEEAIEGWEKAENQVAILKKLLKATILRNSTLEDRVTHLDIALKECVRQLIQTREKQEPNKIDFMYDFVENEEFSALLETNSESMYMEDSLRSEFDIMSQQMAQLTEKLMKVEAEKAELEIALVKSEYCNKASQVQLKKTRVKLEELQMIEKQFISMEREAQTISAKVESLEAEVYKERATSAEIAIKFKELTKELESMREEEKLRSIVCPYGEMKINQEDLAVAAGKFAECQKTIASMGNQLKSLATMEDFLIETASILGLSASPWLIAGAEGETWNLHYSNGTFSPIRGSSSSLLTKNEESSKPSLSNDVGSVKNRNGFAKFFSRTENGIRLEI